MSAQQCFVYCFDCNMLGYGVPDSNGVYQRDSASAPCWDHSYHVFGDPMEYPQPIKWVLAKLQAGHEVTDNEIVLFKLSMFLDDIQPNSKGLRRAS